MNRRTLLKSILAAPFVPKILCRQTKEKTNNDVVGSLDFKQTLDKRIYPEKSNYTTQMVYYSGNVVLLEGQYVIYILEQSAQIKGTSYILGVIRKAKSWKDLMESIDNNTFAGVAKDRTQGPGFVKIYAARELI